ncbi:MAG TPA: DUF1802 family protein [Planctomycetaceae bacterium]
MQTSNRFAFKEWAAVCRAVAAGRQTVLLRKGGIHERRGRFAVEHDEFWLFPTRFHQSDEELSDEGRGFLAEARATEPEAGFVRLSEYVTVADVLRIEREEVLPALRSFHVYADRVLSDRFRYKQPGLTLLVVRAFAVATPVTIPDSPHFAGCRSWVDLPAEIATSGLRPALDDATFGRLRGEVRSAVETTATA